MPRVIAPGAVAPLSLDAFVAAVDAVAAHGPLGESELAALGPVLAGLGADRRFLGDYVARELERRCAHQVRANRYTAQVILLHQGANWFARACLWPAAGDAAVRASGTAPFFYGVPHDHNFNFLTCGYLGPGYWSDYHERDPHAPDPLPGDVAGLIPRGRRRLGEGELLLYREGRDVHCQWPADAFSVSINILPMGAQRPFRSQYRFDIEGDRVAARLTRSPLDALLPLAAHLGGAAGRGLVAELGVRHRDHHIRFAAIAAQAGAAPDPATRRAVLEQAAGGTDGAVARLATERLAMLALAQRWAGTGSREEAPPTGTDPFRRA